MITHKEQKVKSKSMFLLCKTCTIEKAANPSYRKDCRNHHIKTSFILFNRAFQPFVTVAHVHGHAPEEEVRAEFGKFFELHADVF